MNVKMYLNRLRAIDEIIAVRKRQLKELRKERTFIQGVSYDKERVQTSGNPDPMKASDRILELELEIDRRVEAQERRKSKILEEIESLDNPVHIRLLVLRYVYGMRFEQIAMEMGYSYTRIIHLHGDALQAFSKKIEVDIK